MTTPQRQLGNSGIMVSALGLGCWAIGGPFWLNGLADGWGEVDDQESIRAIQQALALGITFFDTADVYGTGRSERVLGQALHGKRHEAVIATKFGFSYDEASRQVGGTNVTPAYIRRACEASLQRLQTEYIDLYQLHCGATPAEAEGILAALQELVQAGLIRGFGVSTDDPGLAELFAQAPGCLAIQYELNVLHDAPALIKLCEQHQLASIARLPLAQGLLTGKYTASSFFTSDDFRGAGHSWAHYFEHGYPKPAVLEALGQVRSVLSSDGRSLAQGALAWILGRSSSTIPIAGFKNTHQVIENSQALQHGPLPPDQMQAIARLLEGH